MADAAAATTTTPAPAATSFMALTFPQLYAGYERRILVFDVARPGRDCASITCSGGPRKDQAKLPGIISCVACSPDGAAFAAGTYAGHVGVFDPRSPPSAQLQLLLHGHKGGLTQVLYTHDGQFLVTGARQDEGLLVWDVRSASEALYRLQRDTGRTNQRIGFSLEPCGRHLLTGGCSGAVRVFDLQTGSHVDELVAAEGDTVNGCDAHPFLALVAVSTGHRRFPLDADDSGSECSSSSCDEDGGGGAGRRAAASGSAPHGADARGQQAALSAPPAVPHSGGIMNAVRVLRLEHALVPWPGPPPEVDVTV